MHCKSNYWKRIYGKEKNKILKALRNVIYDYTKDLAYYYYIGNDKYSKIICISIETNATTIYTITYKEERIDNKNIIIFIYPNWQQKVCQKQNTTQIKRLLNIGVI